MKSLIHIILFSLIGSSLLAFDYSDAYSFIMGKFNIPPIEESSLTSGHEATKLMYSGEEHSVFIWNIYKGKKDNLYTDLGTYASKSSIVMLQEAMFFEKKAAAFLEKKKNLFWDFGVSFYYSKTGAATGVMNGSEYKTISSKIYRTKHREPFVGTPKMAISQEYKIANTDKSLLVINIHGINRTNTKKLRSQLSPLFEKIDKHSGPVIFGGDFNTRNSSRMDLLKEMASKSNMKIVPLEGDRRKKKLDHVLTKGLEIKSAKLNTALESSDHPAIELKFIIP